MLSEQNEDTKSFSNFLLLPILFAVAVIPLIVKFVIYDPHLAEYSWYTNTTEFAEIFTYQKQNAMLLLDGILVIGFLSLFIKKELPKEKAFLPLAAYFILILLSSLVSVSPYHTWNGFQDIMESAFVLFGYCMICYYTYAVVKTEKQLKVVVAAFFIGIFLLCLIGVFQFFGVDIILSEFGKNILFTGEYRQYWNTLSPTLEKGRVSSTLYNPNYVGVYSCIVIPFLLTLLFSVKKLKYIGIYLLLLAVSVCCLIGSGSKTAILTLMPCLLFLIFYFGKRLGKKMVVIVAAGITVLVMLNAYQGENSVFSKVWSRLTAGYKADKVYALTDITLNDTDFTITYKDTILTVYYEKKEENGYTLHVKDENGVEMPIQYVEEEGNYYLDDEAYEALSFKILIANDTQIGYVVSSEGYDFGICYSASDETYYYLNYYGKYTKLYSAERFDTPLFHIMNGFSGRDFIWGKSIPILKETLILGSGPDTYSFMFPQYDYIDKAHGGYPTTLITKPHNTYLQIGIQTGVLSLIAYLAFYVIYFVQSAKLYLKRELSTFTERCGGGIFISSICFMIAGLINDSTIGVSIVFWTLLGVGHACNGMIKRNEDSDRYNIEATKKWNVLHSILGVVVFSGVVLGANTLFHMNDGEPQDGRAIFETDMIADAQSETIPYEALLTMEWTFEDSSTPSSDAYIENAENNQTPVYIEVMLESGECIYTSPIIYVGEYLENIVLDTEVSPGTYNATVIYHLLDSDTQNELATAQIPITISIFH